MDDISASALHVIAVQELLIAHRVKRRELWLYPREGESTRAKYAL